MALLGACAQEEHPLTDTLQDAGQSQSASVGVQACAQAHAEGLPQRLVAIGEGGDAGGPEGGGGTMWFVSDLYNRFESICGRCHGSVQGLGGFAVASQGDFQAKVDASVLAHITSNGPRNPAMTVDPTDPNEPMPPVGDSDYSPWDNRSDTDAVRQLGELIQQWIADGSPLSFQYNLPGTGGGQGSSGLPIPNAYVGNSMTNIGNCIPTAALVGTEQARSQQLDAMFAAAQASVVPGASAAQMLGLPEHLHDTDLFTLDSAVLAQYGVVAYAPNYPLWSDNAGKLRHVRVPRGTSIAFDKATQTFKIPPNTRFYKTFTKPIIDTDGTVRYKKVETRLIVARPDMVNADGSLTPTALFGTYKWADDESDAQLEETPLNNGQPFGDDLFTYTTNEPLAADILSSNPLDPTEALLENGAARHYAIPSSQRCIQCHMGSQSHAFVLGFIPLQINRRPTGQGGTIETTGPDELSQLQRLVDYGVISGISSPSDVLPLERSEGTRSPRNNYELTAQGYVLGNCSHCHNPHGYPSVQNPVLVSVLDFLPSESGGVFQFPLERYSPRIQRGTLGTTPIPYITPSLMDQPRYDSLNNAIEDLFLYSSNSTQMTQAVYGPWRSIIFRNVDSEFAYTDDLALYPHMPMNTPGYDPRGKQILSDWMVSIPAVRKHPEIPEYAFFNANGGGANPVAGGGTTVDATAQPYVEVFPGDPRYPGAVRAAAQRLTVLHTGLNPAFPPDATRQLYSHYADPGSTDDILDPLVEADPDCHEVPTAPAQNNYPTNNPLPAHPHWVITDLTQPPGFSVRRIDWTSILAEQTSTSFAASDSLAVECGLTTAGNAAAQHDEAKAIAALQNVYLADATSFLSQKMPFTTWQKQSGCDYSKQPAVKQFTQSAKPPLWMLQPNAPPPDAPVYTQTPGQAVFKMICINCHGPLADANGRLAQNLATMTGGRDEVADFRDGLFGPPSMPGANMQQSFGSGVSVPAWDNVPVPDRAARYLSWMALGGTDVTIPQGILSIVQQSPVEGIQRVVFSGSQVSANMLSSAKANCGALLGPVDGYETAQTGQYVLTFNPDGSVPDPTEYSLLLIKGNGDRDLWLGLCSLNNQIPVHVLQFNAGHLSAPHEYDPDGTLNVGRGDLLMADPTLYAGQPLGNEHGCCGQGLTADNSWPWCVRSPADPTDHDLAVNTYHLPICPQAADTSSNYVTTDQADTWAVRGAINAGLSVFEYIQDLEKHSSPPPDYNQCPAP